MELLAYVLAVLGLLILIKGFRPTLLWISKTTDKELVKGVGFIALLMTVLFYIFVMVQFLRTY